MEYKELEELWKKYDSKLDKLENLNKKLLKETLLKRPRRKLGWHKFYSLYGLIMTPIILIVALHPNFTKENIDWKFLIGCGLSIMVVIYFGYINLKSYLIVQNIDLSKDSIIDSTNRVIAFKKIYNIRWKHAFIYYPVIYSGVILIAWNSFVFDSKTIVFLIGLFIVTYIANIIGPKTTRNRITRLEKDILNLKEYIE